MKHSTKYLALDVHQATALRVSGRAADVAGHVVRRPVTEAVASCDAHDVSERFGSAVDRVPRYRPLT